MERDKQNEKSIEELSSLLDKLNVGRESESDDAETAELLAVAKLIKSADLKVHAPPHILQQTADKALEGLNKNKKSRFRTWLFSGSVGVAATILLAAGLNLIPSWSEQIAPIQQQTPVTDVADGQAGARQEPTVLSAAPEEEKQAELPVILTEVKVSQDAKVDKPVAAPADISRNVSQPAKPAPAKSAPKAIMTEEKNNQPEAYISRYNAANAQLTPLVLPGKIPGLVETDYVSNTIRQVYDKDTARQLVVTQAMTRIGAAAKEQKPGSNGRNADDKAELTNKVTVIIMDREVTLEGPYSKQELLKMAESLVLAE